MVQNSQPDQLNQSSEPSGTNEEKKQKCIELRDRLLDDIQAGNLSDKEKMAFDTIIKAVATYVSRGSVSFGIEKEAFARGASMTLLLKFLTHRVTVDVFDAFAMADYIRFDMEGIINKVEDAMANKTQKNTELEN